MTQAIYTGNRVYVLVYGARECVVHQLKTFRCALFGGCASTEAGSAHEPCLHPSHVRRPWLQDESLRQFASIHEHQEDVLPFAKEEVEYQAFSSGGGVKKKLNSHNNNIQYNTHNTHTIHTHTFATLHLQVHHPHDHNDNEYKLHQLQLNLLSKESRARGEIDMKSSIGWEQNKPTQNRKRTKEKYTTIEGTFLKYDS